MTAPLDALMRQAYTEADLMRIRALRAGADDVVSVPVTPTLPASSAEGC